jgi:anion-transporting  ArsA/GET3 family ATPase
MVEKKEDLKKEEDKFEEAIEKLRESSENLRKNLKDGEGTAIKTISAGMSVLPKEARTHIISAHKEAIEAGKVIVEDYLEALNNLIKEVSK